MGLPKSRHACMPSHPTKRVDDVVRSYEVEHGKLSRSDHHFHHLCNGCEVTIEVTADMIIKFTYGVTFFASSWLGA